MRVAALVMGAFFAAAAAAAAAAADAKPRTPVTDPFAPKPPNPSAIVTCRVTAEELTADCNTAATTDLAADRALLDALATRPLRLPGAPADAKLEISLWRDEVARGRPTPPSWSGVSYMPVRTTIADPESVSRYYPDRATRMEVEGSALTRCRVTDDGRLNECWNLSETPAEYGFGWAAVRISGLARTPPPDGTAPPYEQRIFDYKMYFRLPHDVPPAAPEVSK